jgi:hypothetical protein
MLRWNVKATTFTKVDCAISDGEIRSVRTYAVAATIETAASKYCYSADKRGGCGDNVTPRVRYGVIDTGSSVV